MKFSLSDITHLVFPIITFSSIIYYKQRCYDKLSARNEWKTNYDYIIIGAGSAGSTIAARLSEDPQISILLIEAGGSETVVSNTPALAESLLNTIMDWKFLSTKQKKSCFAYKDQKCGLTSGRVIGGTSSISRMIYLRGNPHDFDNWEQLGVKGWSWKDVFPVFLKTENQTNSELAKSGYYGVNGPLNINSDYDSNPILDSWLDSSESFGYRSVDLNSGSQIGTSVLPTNIKDGKRVSTATAFLEPVIYRDNLHVLANSYVTKILIDENNKAIGVNFIRNWQKYTVYAREEVILSAGTINSAKLLMLSGIGPKQHLEELEIPVISDLPVGRNFHDHITTLGIHFTINASIDEALTIQSLHRYFNTGKGPLSQGHYAATSIQSEYVDPHLDWPDIILMTSLWSPARDSKSEVSEQRYGIDKDLWKQFYGPYAAVPQFTVWPINMRPSSRGWVQLKSTNALDPPAINPNYFDNISDIYVLLDAIRETFRIVSSKPFQELNTKPYLTLVPGCESYITDNSTSINEKAIMIDNTTIISESYFQCLIRSLTMSFGDYVGTCRMGANDDPNKVVDSKLKVFGVNSLRVIDASIIPQILSATINAATIMIGERGSQFVRYDYYNKVRKE